MIGSWISDCCANHKICAQNVSSVFSGLPTRLVDIRTSRDGVLRVVSVCDVDTTHLRYAALSYCWGRSASITTTKNTLPNMLAGFAQGSLPSTLSDAINVARRLGLRYVWIDALCIIQDDHMDWQFEAQKMGDIYRNAFLTIAAIASSSAEDEFLLQRDSTQGVLVHYTSSRHPELNGEYMVKAYSDSGEDADQFIYEIGSSNWNKRGWTFQERYLSRRILFFGKKMLHFECRTLCRSEGYAGELRRTVKWQLRLQSQYSWLSLRSNWRRLILEYSNRSFTYEKDRLPAISGLARELRTALASRGISAEYYAGIWSMYITEELLWTCTRFSPTSRRRGLGPIAHPSWTWASRKGQIAWLQPGGDSLTYSVEPKCEIISIKVQNSGIDKMGNVLDGEIKARGYLMGLSVDFYTAAKNLAIGQPYMYTCPYDFGYHTYGHHSFVLTFDGDMDLQDFAVSDRRIIYLALLATTRGAKRDGAFGLILSIWSPNNSCEPDEPNGLQESRNDKFYRIGIFQTRMMRSFTTNPPFYVDYPDAELENVLPFYKNEYTII
jgi:hypothetical protein